MFFSHKVNVPEILSPVDITRSPDETKLESMEKKRTAALEMAKKEDEKKKEGAAAEKEVKKHHRCPCPVGAWGSQVSSRAPVMNGNDCQRVCRFVVPLVQR